MSAVMKIEVDEYFHNLCTDHFKLGNMYRQEILILLVLVIVSINAYPSAEKLCSLNLKINGTSLITFYRNQALVIGISHLGCQACRNQAIRYD